MKSSEAPGTCLGLSQLKSSAAALARTCAFLENTLFNIFRSAKGDEAIFTQGQKSSQIQPNTFSSLKCFPLTSVLKKNGVWIRFKTLQLPLVFRKSHTAQVHVDRWGLD